MRSQFGGRTSGTAFSQRNDSRRQRAAEGLGERSGSSKELEEYRLRAGKLNRLGTTWRRKKPPRHLPVGRVGRASRS